ncbi:MAG TPA: 3-oxoadipate enol-lactonase [Roseiarcus sp.]|jgi:3-oxoadipate enol-lactonase/4-carboxymuconolactone decarboxylase
MRVVRTGGTTLHVEAHLAPGRPTVVFLNSLGSDLRIWDEVVEALARSGVGALRYDLRGQGLSDTGTTPYRIADHVADLEAVLASCGVARATICGLSVGGMIALGLAEKRPELVAGLVLCCTGHRIGTSESWNARIAAVENGGVRAVAETVLQGWFSPNAYRDNTAGVALCRNMLTRSPVDGYLATCAAVRDADLEPAARGVTAPVLCIAGEHDRATPPQLVGALSALIPGARLAVIPGAGHMPCVEAPVILADHLLGFVREISAPAADRFTAGMAVRRHVLGEAHVDAAEHNKTKLDADFQRFITEGAWGSVWSRSGLTLRERSMLTIALLAALGHDGELAMHTRATRNTGAAPEDIAEALLHVAVYAGVPAANKAFQTVKKTLKAMEEET